MKLIDKQLLDDVSRQAQITIIFPKIQLFSELFMLKTVNIKLFR